MRRLYAHRAMMAPHQKERAGGALFVDAIREIERLRGIIARNTRTRLSGEEGPLYITPKDINDSLEILYAEMERERANSAPNGS